MTRETPADITINNITIKKPGGEELPVIPAPTEGDSMEELFVNLNINEGIFQSGVHGTLKIKEPGAAGDYFNLLGNEKIEISFETPDVSNSSHELTFCINDVKFLGDETMDALGGPSARAGAGWELNFISCENQFLNWDELDYMEEDFIGRIDELVEDLADKYFNPGSTDFSFAQEDMVVEETSNYIWLKKNQSMYPWGKDVHPPNLMNLMNNLTENAVTEDEKGVNYVFYADLDGWHFKSIRKMIADSEPTWFGLVGGPRQYRICDEDVTEDKWTNGDPRIRSHRILGEYDHLKLWQNGAYSSYYELIKPDYSDPYFDYIDFTTQHQNPEGEKWGERIIVDYDYHRDVEEWGEMSDGGRVEQYKLIPDRFKTEIDIDDPKNIDKKSRRKYDETGLYGYFDNPYNYPNQTPYDHLGSAALEGKQGKYNDILWQTMFDQTELEGEIIKKIQKEIKEPARENFGKHLQVMNLKEKFNVYRHSICCDKQSIKPLVFFALIHDAKKITDDARGGIYEYSWKEVEMWPKDFVDEIKEGVEEIDYLHENNPFTIIVPEGALEGKIQESEDEEEEYSSPAYNLNELMNKKSGDDVFIGPGVNAADEDYNDYPEAYQMMPVGGYFEIGEDGVLNDPCEEIEDGVHPNVSYENHGHIVQMYRIPNYMLGAKDEEGEIKRGSLVPIETELGEEPDKSIPEDIYVFDVPNAHDGLCGCL